MKRHFLAFLLMRVIWTVSISRHVLGMLDVFRGMLDVFTGCKWNCIWTETWMLVGGFFLFLFFSSVCICVCVPVPVFFSLLILQLMIHRMKSQNVLLYAILYVEVLVGLKHSSAEWYTHACTHTHAHTHTQPPSLSFSFSHEKMGTRRPTFQKLPVFGHSIQIISSTGLFMWLYIHITKQHGSSWDKQKHIGSTQQSVSRALHTGLLWGWQTRQHHSVMCQLTLNYKWTFIAFSPAQKKWWRYGNWKLNEYWATWKWFLWSCHPGNVLRGRSPLTLISNWPRSTAVDWWTQAALHYNLATLLPGWAHNHHGRCSLLLCKCTNSITKQPCNVSTSSVRSPFNWPSLSTALCRWTEQHYSLAMILMWGAHNHHCQLVCWWTQRAFIRAWMMFLVWGVH